ncbi:hypothetical protein WKH24_21735 [Pantoea agglomerans]|jgi:hypothetical protein|uniref:Copper resistance protein n=1 Tax=Enterobacter agglomerans TaxID=549 RepID=A0ABD6XL23_ENTAG|nr:MULTISPECIES: hypothetical protein [Erwiniaceae]MCH9408176.1 hypothetical protein [Pantoea agglomerans]NKE96773.1 hypothetical protein [Pantoea agglomerans]QTC52508.1 hypothetical protein H0Z11_20960 [Pantoea agglomerans]TRO71633.1 hypothetical protein E5140_17985 [Pantoea agglomerans]WNK33318.1 hypothetical protein RM157_23515 [Pantoea agglomerans]
MLIARYTYRVLIMACMVIVFCMAQHSFNPHVYSSATIVMKTDHGVSEAKTGNKPCELSSKTLHIKETLPDLLVPFLILIQALITVLCCSALRKMPAEPIFNAPRRRHLTFCVFQE